MACQTVIKETANIYLCNDLCAEIDLPRHFFGLKCQCQSAIKHLLMFVHEYFTKASVNWNPTLNRKLSDVKIKYWVPFWSWNLMETFTIYRQHTVMLLLADWHASDICRYTHTHRQILFAYCYNHEWTWNIDQIIPIRPDQCHWGEKGRNNWHSINFWNSVYLLVLNPSAQHEIAATYLFCVWYLAWPATEKFCKT